MTLEDTGNAPSPGVTDDLRAQTTATDAPVAQTETIEPNAPSIDDDLKAVWEKHNPARDDSGRFASRNQSDPETAKTAGIQAPDETEGQPPATEDVEQVKAPAIDAPVSWPKEMKERWATLPPDAQEFIARRESEAHAKISQMGNEVATYKPVAQVLEQHKDLFTKRGLSFDKGIALLVNAQRMLENNPVAAIAEIARVSGVDPSVFGSNPIQQQEYAAVVAERSQLNSENQQLRAELETLRFSQYQTPIEQFLSESNLTESDAEYLAPYVEAETKKNPNAPPGERLRRAFESYQFSNPEKREAIIVERMQQEMAKQKAEAEKKAAEAKKLASLNVKSSPNSSKSHGSMDDTLAEVARKHYRT